MKAAAKDIVASLAHEADVEPLDVLLRTIRLDRGAVQWVTSKIIEADWTDKLNCGNYNTVTKKCSKQNY